MKKLRWIALLALVLAVVPAFALAGELVLPAGLVTIKEEAFAGDTALDSVILPEGLETIGSGAFAGSSLRRIMIPSSVESIGGGAFSDCGCLHEIVYCGTQETWDILAAGSGVDGLSNVTVRCLTSGEIVDSGTCAEHLKWTLYTDGLLVISGTGPMTNYSYSNESPWDESQITGVLIMPGVTSIGDYAFYNYNNTISSVMLPNSVERIGENAFYTCVNLTEITIPSGVLTIGYDAFSFCLDLEKINVAPDNNHYSSIDGVLFNKQQTMLLTFPEGKNLNGYYMIPSSVTEIAEKAFDSAHLSAITIPDSVSEIGFGAFENCWIQSVELPSGLTAIQFFTFASCEQMKSIYIPASVTMIDYGAFSSCSALTDIYYQGSEDDWNAMFIEDDNDVLSNVAFHWNTDLQSDEYLCGLFTFSSVGADSCAVKKYIGAGDHVTIPKKNLSGQTVVSIGTFAFSGNSYITNVSIPDTVESIGFAAFENCTVLSDISLPESLTSIGTSAFYGCERLSSIHLPDSLATLETHVFHNCSGLTNVTLPNQMTNVPDWTFAGCTSLKSIEIPSAVQRIGTSAFNGCSGLEQVIFHEGLVSISQGAFRACGNLTEIRLPQGLTALSSDAFGECESLSFISFPDSITDMYESCIYGCTGLTRIECSWESRAMSVLLREYHDIIVEIPAAAHAETPSDQFTFDDTDDGYAVTGYTGSAKQIVIPSRDANGTVITAVASGAFKNNTSITSVILPDTIRSIGSEAFMGCSSLQFANIPEGVTRIQNDTFNGCSQLNRMRFPFTLVSVGDRAFQGFGLRKIDFNEGLKSVGDYAFSNCGFDFGCAFPSTLESIGAYAFFHCGMESIVLPVSLVTVGESAFESCRALKNVTIQPGLKTISNCMFADCRALASIVLPNTITKIGDDAFFQYAKNCGLESIVIPNSVNEIGHGAFRNTRISNITIPDSCWKLGSAFAECANLVTANIVGYNGEWIDIGYDTFENCVNLVCVKLPNMTSKLNAYDYSASLDLTSVFSGCSSLTTIYCEPDSTVWTWAEENGYTSTDAPWPYGDNGGNPALTFSGFFTETEITMEVGQTVQPSGEVTSTTANIGRVTLTIDGYNIEGDENDRYATKIFSGVQSVNLADYPVFTLDGAREPLNMPGTYTARLWAKKVGIDDEAVLLNEISIHVTIPDTMLSGIITLSSGTPISFVYVYIIDADEETTVYTISDQNGKWSVSGLEPGKTYSVLYGSLDYIITNMEEIYSPGNYVVATASIYGENNANISFEMKQNGAVVNTIEVGTSIDFTVNAPMASYVRLVVDGVPYESYEIVNDTAVFSRMISSVGSGMRSIQIQAFTSEDDWFAISEPQTLMVTYNGEKLTVPKITNGLSLEKGAPLYVSWDEVQNASSYAVYVFSSEGVQLWPDWQSSKGNNITIPTTHTTIDADIFKFIGKYSLQVVATGKGYDSSTAIATLNVKDSNSHIQLSLPSDVKNIGIGDVLSINVNSCHDLGKCDYTIHCNDTINTYISGNTVSFKASGEFILTGELTYETETYESEPLIVKVSQPIIDLSIEYQEGQDIRKKSNILYYWKNVNTDIKYRLKTNFPIRDISVIHDEIDNSDKLIPNGLNEYTLDVYLDTANMKEEYVFSVKDCMGRTYGPYCIPIYVLDNSTVGGTYVTLSDCILYDAPDKTSNDEPPELHTRVSLGGGKYDDYVLIKIGDDEYFVKEASIDDEIPLQRDGIQLVEMNLENPSVGFIDEPVHYTITAAEMVDKILVKIGFVGRDQFAELNPHIEISDDRATRSQNSSTFTYSFTPSEYGYYKIAFLPVDTDKNNMNPYLMPEDIYCIARPAADNIQVYFKYTDEYVLRGIPNFEIYTDPIGMISNNEPMTVLGYLDDSVYYIDCTLVINNTKAQGFISQDCVRTNTNERVIRGYYFVSYDIMNNSDKSRNYNDSFYSFKRLMNGMEGTCHCYYHMMGIRFKDIMQNIQHIPDDNDVTYICIFAHGNKYGLSWREYEADSWRQQYNDDGGKYTLDCILNYYQLQSYLESIHGKVILIMPSCHAGAAIDIFEQQNVLPKDRYSVLAAVSSAESAWADDDNGEMFLYNLANKYTGLEVNLQHLRSNFTEYCFNKGDNRFGQVLAMIHSADYGHPAYYGDDQNTVFYNVK